MEKERRNGESKVKELAEKLQKEEISPEEAVKKLDDEKLTEKTAWSRAFEIVPWFVYFGLWLPLSFLFSDRIPVVRFPPVVIYISVALAISGMALLFWSHHCHRKLGGLNQMETVRFFREGPYRVVRHPEAVGSMPLIVLLPVIFSVWVPFTPFSIAAILMVVAYECIGIRMEEERLDIPKWGDEYRRYMKEVPRYNLIKGLWNLRKRKE